MFTTFKRQSFLLLALAVLGFTACKKSSSAPDETPEEKQYGLLVSAGTPAASYILNTSDLTRGTLTTAGNGAETNINVITQRGEFFYGVNASGNLVKFKSSNKTTTIVSQVQFNQISWAYYSSFFAWKDEKTLVLFSMNQALQFEYATLNVETMTITASGNINIPLPPSGYYYWGNNVAFLGNKLYISYNVVNSTTDVPLNEIRLASMDFPNVSNVTVTTDTRFNQPAHYNLNSPGTFVYNNYAYMLNAPTIWIFGETGGSFSIYRVASGTTATDVSYQFELTDRTKEEVSGLFNLGNGKAVIKVIDKTQISSYQDYAKRISEFYVIDVVNKTKTKLNIPKSVATPYSNDIMVDGNVAYIAASTADGYYVYTYDAASGNLSRGAKLDGVNGVNQLVKYK